MKIVLTLLLTLALCFAPSTTVRAAEILLRHSTIDVAPLMHHSRSRLASHPNPIPQSVEHSQHATNLLSMDGSSGGRGMPVRRPADDRGDAHRQWMVHVKSPITHQVKSNINAHIAPFSLSSTYFPDDTFLLVAPRHVAERIHDAPGVLYVAEFAPVFKHDSDVDDHVLDQIDAHHEKRLDKLRKKSSEAHAFALASVENSRVKLHVTLATKSSRAENERMARSWIAELDAHFGVEGIELVHASNRNFVALSAPKENVHHIVRNLASFHEIHWVEVAAKLEVMNKYAHAITQTGSSDYTLTTIWDKGLRGEGQVVGIADTGIDYDMCFFWDEDVAIPFNEVNMDHRKIVTYHQLGSDREDVVDGHGTHTSGTLAGDVLEGAFGSSSTADLDLLREFNGMANKAKMAFYDLGDEDEFEVPDDLYEDFYALSYDSTGARIHSNSWGANTPYGLLSLHTDDFVNDFPDFLPVYAAGNDGDDGLFTIASPSVAKNALAVGASTNSATSFFSLGLVAGVDIIAPVSAQGTHRIVPAAFGPDIHADRFAEELQNVEAAISEPYDACDAITNAGDMVGKVMLMQRGTCNFFDKAERCEQAGAVLCVVVNTDDEYLVMGGDPSESVSVPTVLVRESDGQILLDNIDELVLTAPVDVEVDEFSANLLADFSSRGPAGDGRLKPDIVAPGQYVQSARSDGDPSSFQCTDDSLLSLQGTSMATPLTAGAVALAREYFMKGYFPTGVETPADAITPSAALLKAIMINSGQEIGSFTETDPVLELTPPSIYQGYGQVTMDAVLKFNDSDHSLFFSDASDVAALGSTTYCFDVNSFDVPFKATLVWTDPPPSQSSLRILINNLDLTVAHVESEELYLGNNRQFTDSDGTLFTAHDEQNNVEQVWLEPGAAANQPSVEMVTDAQTGVYVIRVIGYSVPIGPLQTYSLVVTGDFDQSSTGSCAEFPDINICPKDCSGHGTCNEGLCECENGYFNADCSQEPTTLDLNAARADDYSGSVDPMGWQFFRAEVDPLDEALFGGDNEEHVVKVYMDRTGGAGDPDVFIAINDWPTLEAFEYWNTECDPCGVTNHVTDIDPSELVSRAGATDYTMTTDEQMAVVNETATTTVVVGVYGYCCADASFRVSVGTGLPESEDGLVLSALVIALIAIFSCCCCCGIGFCIYRKRSPVPNSRRVPEHSSATQLQRIS